MKSKSLTVALVLAFNLVSQFAFAGQRARFDSPLTVQIGLFRNAEGDTFAARNPGISNRTEGKCSADFQVWAPSANGWSFKSKNAIQGNISTKFTFQMPVGELHEGDSVVLLAFCHTFDGTISSRYHDLDGITDIQVGLTNQAGGQIDQLRITRTASLFTYRAVLEMKNGLLTIAREPHYYFDPFKP